MNFRQRLRKILQDLQLGSLDTRFDILDRQSQLKYLHCQSHYKRQVRIMLKQHKMGLIEVDKIVDYINEAYQHPYVY